MITTGSVAAVDLAPPVRPALGVGTPLGAWAATLFITMALACATPRGADQPQDARR